jgi:hypothetical protein
VRSAERRVLFIAKFEDRRHARSLKTGPNDHIRACTACFFLAISTFGMGSPSEPTLDK